MVKFLYHSTKKYAMQSKSYKIEWEAWNDYESLCMFMNARKSNMDHTTMLWLDCGYTFDEDGEVTHHQSPVLLWLN